mmetsp:Transcript_16898/g.28108  ORF Transcript_16898/g.28108 Transcript_16898/m.28108 type:complete len:123 (-) Transcript_16898:237-605(-)
MMTRRNSTNTRIQPRALSKTSMLLIKKCSTDSSRVAALSCTILNHCPQWRRQVEMPPLHSMCAQPYSTILEHLRSLATDCFDSWMLTQNKLSHALHVCWSLRFYADLRPNCNGPTSIEFCKA